MARQFHRYLNPDGTMIVSFKDEGTRDIFRRKDTRPARQSCPPTLWTVAYRKLEALDGAKSLDDLAIPSGNRLEPLKGDRAGQFSIRVNLKFRICFRWMQSGPAEVEIVDYH